MISVVINALNEEKHIADCIHSVQGLADEIVVCDMYSDDRTVEIAQDLGARIVYHERMGFVEPARHYAISQASHEWVLVLDADERMTEELARRLKQATLDNSTDVVKFRFLYECFGDFLRHDIFFRARVARFFRKTVYLETCREDEILVHGNFSSIARLASRQLELPSDYYVLHLAYPTIEEYACKTLGTYARIEGEQYFEQGRRFSWLQLLLEPFRTFMGRYIVRQGFREGVRGFILCTLMAGYRFMIWANVWLLEETESQR